MAQYPQKLSDKTFQNYIKEGLALLFAKEGLEDFVLDVITCQQNDILQHIYNNNGVQQGVICTSCTTKSAIPCPTKGICKTYSKGCSFHCKNIPTTCPNKICSLFWNRICHYHQFGGPSWKNTDASQWCVDPYSVAKCYMPPDGYLHVNTPHETDFNGIIAVLINNKCFDTSKISSLAKKKLKQVREIGKLHRHSPDLSIQDSDLAKNLDTLIDLLNDPVCLRGNTNAQRAIQILQQIKSDSLTITPDDITRVLENVIELKTKEGKEEIDKCTESKMEEIAEFTGDKTKYASEEITEHAKRKTEESLLDIESKTTNSKEDIDKHATSKKKEIDEHVSSKIRDMKEDLDKHADIKTKEAMEFIRKEMQNTKKEIDEKKLSEISELQEMKMIVSKMSTDEISHIFHPRTSYQTGLLSDLVMSRIAAKLGFEWNIVALELGLTQANIEQIQISHKFEGAHKMILSALLKWRDNSTGTDKEKIEVLMEAIRNSNRNDLADELMAQYIGS